MKSSNLYHHKHSTSSSKIGKNSLTNVIESKTVLEKKQFVSTGILTYIEGDIVEVEISDWQVFFLGDSLKVTIYSPLGILTFESTIVAKDIGSVIILLPPEIQKRFMDKREHPRVEVSQTGTINTAFQTATRQKAIELSSPIQFVTTDISMGGIGFVLQIGEQDLHKFMHIEVEIELGFTLPSYLELIRKTPVEDGMFYGAKLIDTPQDKLISLRSFIMRAQVANYFKQKKSYQ